MKHTISYKNKKKNILWVVGFVWIVIAFLIAWRIFSFMYTPNQSTQLKQPLAISQSPTNNLPLENTLYPSQILNLSNWKVTLPFGSEDNNANPAEVKQPDLATYMISPWFVITSDRKGVIFRAPVNGVTTSGSNYPRSELREMTNNGETQANWQSTEGVHTMVIDEAITAIPKVKKQIIAGQIHDGDSDVIVVRLDNTKLYITVSGDNVYLLDSHYTLGKRFTIKFVVRDGETEVYFNNSTNAMYILKKEYTNAYFKAGAYTQSNCITEKNNSLCTANNFGEVVIYNLEVTHQ